MGGRCDQGDQVDAVWFADTGKLLFFFIRKIRNDDSINAAFYAAFHEAFFSVGIDWVDIGHKHHRNFYSLAGFFYHIKQFIGGASCSECSLARFLDDLAFGDRIGKRDTDLDQVSTGFFHGDQQIFCGFKVWIPTCYKRDKCFFIFECLIYITHRYPLLCIVQWQPRLCRRVLK